MGYRKTDGSFTNQEAPVILQWLRSPAWNKTDSINLVANEIQQQEEDPVKL